MSGMTSPSYSYNQEFLVETVNLTLEFLSDIIYACSHTGEFIPEKEFYWNKKITKLTADVSQFVELTTLLSKTIMVKKNLVITGVKESHLHLLYVMKAMNQAREKQDYVALEDLIKYELKDNLTQWKIDLLPQIKKLLTT